VVVASSLITAYLLTKIQRRIEIPAPAQA
jgi:hypothetical protein